MTINVKKNKNLYFALTVILLFFIVAVIIARSQFIWLDEAYTLHTTSGSFRQVWLRAMNFEGQPPFYFIILKVWRYLSDSVFFARLFSIITVTISIFIIYLISKKYISNINPLIIILFFASNSLLLWAALEIRVYGLVLLMSVVSVWLFLNIYNSKQKPALNQRILYSAIALIAVYTQYYLVFLFIGNFIFLLTVKKWDTARLYVIDMLLPALGVILLISNITEQISIHSYQDRPIISLSTLVNFQFRKVSTYLFPYFHFVPSGFLHYLIIFVLLVIIFVFARENLKRQHFCRNYFFIISITLIIFFTFLLFLTDRRNIAQRHTISLLLPLIMALGLILGAIKSAKVKYSILVLMIAGNVTVNMLHYGLADEKGVHYEEVSDFINTNDNDNAPVFCFRYDLALILDIGLPTHKVVPIPVNVDFDSPFDRKKWVLKSTNQLDSLFAVNDINDGFWLVTSENDSVLNKSIEKRYNIHYNYVMLNEYISKNFNVELKKQIHPGLVLRRVMVSEK